MKKIFIGFITLILLTSVAAAMIFPTIKVSISTAGYVAVPLPTGQSSSSYSLWTEDGSAWYISSQSDGSDGILVTSDGSSGLPISVVQALGKDAYICYAKGTTSTHLVGLITK